MSVEEIEILRKKAMKLNLICIFGTIIIIGLEFLLLRKDTIIIFLSVVICLITSLLITKKPNKDFRDEFKKTFVFKSLDKIFSNLVYKPEAGLDEAVIRNTQMMYMGDRYSSNDYFSGNYKNISVEQADVHIQEERTSTDSNGNTTTTLVTIFMGRWMIFDFNKFFKANIQVCEKGFGNSRVSRNQQARYIKVSMEDEMFNKNFRVFAQDEHDAFYILTPSLMEKIKKLQNEIKGRFLLCFINNKLHVGVSNGKDSFEHSVYKKINEEKDLQAISSDIELITKFVDDLNLDNDLFRREV